MNWLADDDAVARWCDWAGTILLNPCQRAQFKFHNTQEAVQEALTQAWRFREEFRGQSEGEFRAYLLRIAHNYLISKSRRTNREKSLDDVPHEPTATISELQQTSESQQNVLAVRQALEQLSPDQREVLVLNKFEKMTMQAIADRLNISLGNVHARVHRALKRLRELLHEYDPDEQRLAPDSAVIRQRPERPLPAGSST